MALLGVDSHCVIKYSSTQYDEAETLYLVTVKPFPKRISIRRKTRKLTEKSIFPRVDKERI